MSENEHKKTPEAELSLDETDSRDDKTARKRLLDAATQLFAEKGLDGTSTRDLAKTADLNVSLISYYFGGKEGLYKAVISEFAETARSETDRFLEAVDLESLDRETFRQVMKEFVGLMLNFKFQRRDIHLILQREVMQGLPHSRNVYENIFSKITETIVRIYQVGQEKNFVRKEINPYILFLSMVHSSDVYFQVSQCKTGIYEHILKLPEQMDLYIEQVFMVYVEGVLI